MESNELILSLAMNTQECARRCGELAQMVAELQENVRTMAAIMQTQSAAILELQNIA